MRANPHPRLVLTLGVLAVTSLSTGAAPQVLATPQSVEATAKPAGLTNARMRAFRETAGQSWRVRRDEQTGFAKFLFGGSLEPSFRPKTDAEFGTVAREFVVETLDLHGIDPETLADDRVVFLPLASAFSTDKLTARLTQHVDGVPVRGGSVNVLMDTEGRLLSLDSNSLPRLAGFDVRPTISSAAALDLALEIFRSEKGMLPNQASEPRLVVEQETAKGRRPALAWEFDLRFEERGQQHHGATYVMAAQGAPRRISAHELYHSFDVFGTVEAMVSPGILPDIASNPETPHPMAYMQIQTSVGTVTTDVDGNFNIPGENNQVSATFRFEGLYANADNDQGADYELQVNLQPNTQNDVLMNPGTAEFDTAQANAYHAITFMRDWLVGVNPADTILDFQADALTNQTFLVCNATFDGVKTNYFVETPGSCANSSFTSIIYHEMGHFLNQLYGSGNGSDGFGEGAADIWALFIQDDPILGGEWGGPGQYVRSGLNTNAFCGDTGQGCYSGNHANGQPLMGAFWKWRENYNATYGNAAGDLASNILMNAWFNAYDDGQVLSIVEEHLLALDDDDGNIENGTPNFDDLDDGFTQQGWPGFELTTVNFSNEFHPSSSRDEFGPYGVGMDITSAVGALVATADVYYSVDGGAYQSVSMSNVLNDFWAGLVPGQPSPSFIEYYVEVMDTLGNVQSLPRGGAATPLSFRIGVDTVYWSDNFDGPDDNGWTHVQTATQDDWQRDVPTGQSGLSSNVSWQDPTAAFSPPNCWGNDLGVSGFNGAHQPNVDNSLFSPIIDLTGAFDTVLSFKRWLNIERGIYDQSQIYVNGNLVWENPPNDHILDTGWTDFEVDISAFADNNPAVQIEFRLVSDGGLELGGWSIDDLAIISHDTIPTDCLFTEYGAGLAGTLGVPSLDSGGEPMKAGNLDFAIQIKNGNQVGAAYLFAGFAPDSVPALGGTLLVVPDLVWLLGIDGFGQGRLALPIPDDDPYLIGFDVYFQAFILDQSLPDDLSITPGIMLTICDQ